jgi:hypothetical protein
VRAITVVQIIWIVIQIIARAFRSLAISQLEISVVAFATCAIVIYGINWEKPKGVQVPITIISYPGPFPKDTMEIVEGDRDGTKSIFSVIVFFAETLFACLHNLDSTREWPLGKPVPNVYNHEAHWDLILPQSDVFGLFLGATVFGAVHIAAWNFVFPTPVESLLWKISAILCTTVGFVCVGSAILIPFVVESLGDKYDWLMFLIFFPPVSYVVCRLFLVVEIFRCLCFLPPSAYIATWATNVPHVA